MASAFYGRFYKGCEFARTGAEYLYALAGYALRRAGAVRHTLSFCLENGIENSFPPKSLSEQDIRISHPISERVFHVAEKIIDHELDLLGSGPVCISKGNSPNTMVIAATSTENPVYNVIDWHRDLKSGYRWHRFLPSGYYLRRFPIKPGADIKWPWELSRCQYLPFLGLARRFGQQDRRLLAESCVTEFQNQVADWIAANPVGLGVNWASDMDVAIRAVNWVLAFTLFGGQCSVPDHWEDNFWTSISDHASFLYNHTRIPLGRRGNHYAVQAAGLYILACLCPFLKHSSAWSHIARDRLEEQIRIQTRADGTHFEDSTSYHLLVADTFLYAAMLGASVNDHFSHEYDICIEKMVDVVRSFTPSVFDYLQVGDKDDGYFLKPFSSDVQFSRSAHLIALTDIYLGREKSMSPSETIFTILVPNATVGCLNVTESDYNLKVLNSAGWALLNAGLFKIMICLGPQDSKSRKGHSHQDILSLSVFYRGRPVVVDPGTYCYTPFPEIRNKFRYAVSHNQPQFEEQSSDWLHNPVFSPLARPTVSWKVANHDEKCESIAARAQYSTYLAGREISYQSSGGTMQITDSLEGESPGIARLALCIHPDQACRQLNDFEFEIRSNDLSLKLSTEGFLFKREKSPYSPQYGLHTDTTWLIHRQRTKSCNLRWSLSA